MICPNCRKENPEGSKFCTNCGTNFIQDNNKYDSDFNNINEQRTSDEDMDFTQPLETEYDRIDQSRIKAQQAQMGRVKQKNKKNNVVIIVACIAIALVIIGVIVGIAMLGGKGDDKKIESTFSERSTTTEKTSKTTTTTTAKNVTTTTAATTTKQTTTTTEKTTAATTEKTTTNVEN